MDGLSLMLNGRLCGWLYVFAWVSAASASAPSYHYTIAPLHM